MNLAFSNLNTDNDAQQSDSNQGVSNKEGKVSGASKKRKSSASPTFTDSPTLAIDEVTSEVIPLKKLSDYATKMKLNKNYAEIARYDNFALLILQPKY